MPFPEAKVYYDGSHYIAIPHTTKPSKVRRMVIEDKITIQDDVDENVGVGESSSASHILDVGQLVDEVEEEYAKHKNNVTECKFGRVTTKKELFELLYSKYIDLKPKERKEIITDNMLSYFNNPLHCQLYVEAQFARKHRNLVTRRVRMCRKANLANFNYFCTFTYDDKLHTEQTFKKKLKTCLRNMCHRKNWRYMGIWERAPKTNRLHFHGLFKIPDGMLPGILEEIKDYDTRQHKMQISIQSSYFNERFGRSDFKEIDENEKRLGNALAYIMKYIEKTGEKIVYSKGLPQYFISDILDEDVITTIGQEDKKLLLFDNFRCWDEGVLIGNVCSDVIEQMRKCN